MKKTIVFLLCIASSFSLLAKQETTAHDFLQMKTDDAFKIISGMSKEETESLISEIRKQAKTDFKQVDNFYFLISHLEEIKAVEIEQNRLKSLNTVYLLGLALLMSFLVYIFINQRKMIREMNALKKD